jgi:hypothetical protein
MEFCMAIIIMEYKGIIMVSWSTLDVFGVLCGHWMKRSIKG